MALVVKNPPANVGDIRDTAWNPRLGRSPGEGHGNPLQYSCLGNPMDRGAWRATIHGVTKSQTQLKQCTHCSPTSSLSIGFPRQGYWSELPFPSPVDLLDQGWNPCLLHWQVDPSPLGHQGSEPSPEYDDIFYPTVY